MIDQLARGSLLSGNVGKCRSRVTSVSLAPPLPISPGDNDMSDIADQSALSSACGCGASARTVDWVSGWRWPDFCWVVSIKEFWVNVPGADSNWDTDTGVLAACGSSSESDSKQMDVWPGWSCCQACRTEKLDCIISSSLVWTWPTKPISTFTQTWSFRQAVIVYYFSRLVCGPWARVTLGFNEDWWRNQHDTKNWESCGIMNHPVIMVMLGFLAPSHPHQPLPKVVGGRTRLSIVKLLMFRKRISSVAVWCSSGSDTSPAVVTASLSSLRALTSPLASEDIHVFAQCRKTSLASGILIRVRCGVDDQRPCC